MEWVKSHHLFSFWPTDGLGTGIGGHRQPHTPLWNGDSEDSLLAQQRQRHLSHLRATSGVRARLVRWLPGQELLSQELGGKENGNDCLDPRGRGHRKRGTHFEVIIEADATKMREEWMIVHVRNSWCEKVVSGMRGWFMQVRTVDWRRKFHLAKEWMVFQWIKSVFSETILQWYNRTLPRLKFEVYMIWKKMGGGYKGNKGGTFILCWRSCNLCHSYKEKNMYIHIFLKVCILYFSPRLKKQGQWPNSISCLGQKMVCRPHRKLSWNSGGECFWVSHLTSTSSHLTLPPPPQKRNFAWIQIRWCRIYLCLLAHL